MSTNRNPRSEHESVVALTGISYKNFAIAQRERLALDESGYQDFITTLSKRAEVQGAVIVNTCNRTEIVTTTPHCLVPETFHSVVKLWEEVAGVSLSATKEGVYQLAQAPAVKHVFRVAAGLDSMVLGEPQILGQMKSAFRVATQCGGTDFLLQRLFQRAFGVAKKVRAETDISRYPVSVAYAAKVLCEHIFGNLSDVRVLLLGAGETGSLLLRHLRQSGVRRIQIASRTDAHAQTLAEEFCAEVIPWEHYAQGLASADVVVSACRIPLGAPAIVSEAMAADALAQRAAGPQLYVDLGVPRTIADSLGSYEDVFLYNVDDLESVIHANTAQRMRAAEIAERLIDEESSEFLTWLGSRRVHQSIREARRRIQGFEYQEMEKTLRRLRREGFTEAQCKTIEQALFDYSNGLLAKVLHQPFRRLRSATEEDELRLQSFSENFLDTPGFQQSPLPNNKKKTA